MLFGQKKKKSNSLFDNYLLSTLQGNTFKSGRSAWSALAVKKVPN